MELWIENARQSLISAEAEVCADAVRTFQTREIFSTIMVSGACSLPVVDGGAETSASQIAQRALSLLKNAAPLGQAMQVLLADLPAYQYMPFSILQVMTSADDPGQRQACIVECDAPPLFLARSGDLLLPPVMEEEHQGHLVRTGQFLLQKGDHLAIVSEGYVQASGWAEQGGWRGIAIAIKRLTATRCNAEQLLGALVRSYHRLAQDDPARDVSVLAMFVRPSHSATVWTGPPKDPTQDQVMLEKFVKEPGKRVICGDTTAEIAARLLDAELEMEPPPEEGWTKVPPVSRLESVDLVTEGVVTMGKARERIAQAQQPRDLPRKEDGATRLARILLDVDKIHFLVGLAVNPAQTADKAGQVPLRRIAVQNLIDVLELRDKIVSVEYF